MKAEFSRKTLLDAFAVAASVAPSRSPKPILQNVKLTASHDQTTLEATDLEIGLRQNVADVVIHKEGEAILPTDRFGQILRTSNAESLTIEDDDNSILIRAGKSRFTLPKEDPAIFPAIDAFTAEDYLVLTAENLRMMIRRTAFACDLDNTRYALGGALLEYSPGQMQFVCTDGRRLARQAVNADHVGDGIDARGSVVPSKALKLIDRALGKDGDQIHVAVNQGHSVMIRMADAEITARLMEGRFPRYQDVFPQESRCSVDVNVGSLRVGVDQACIVTSDDSRGVDFQFDGDMLRLAARTATVGESDVEVPLDAPVAEPLTITMDGSYLVDALKTLPPDDAIRIDLVDAKSACVLRKGENYDYIVMPVSREH